MKAYQARGFQLMQRFTRRILKKGGGDKTMKIPVDVWKKRLEESRNLGGGTFHMTINAEDDVGLQYEAWNPENSV